MDRQAEQNPGNQQAAREAHFRGHVRTTFER
jgi:hypothetical protein